MMPHPHYPRATAAVFALLILIEGMGGAALAETETCESHGITYNCITESVAEQQIRAGYLGLGNGTIDPATVQQEWAKWPTSLSNFGKLPSGVSLSALMETPIRVSPANNGTAYINPNVPIIIHGGGATGTYLTAYSFNVALNATQTGSGFSEWYYRSPILYRDDLYEGHAVVMSDALGVIASDDCPGVTVDCERVGDRLFYHFQGLFPSGRNVTITEYLRPRAGGPQVLDFLDVYASLYQDIDGNGREVDFFPNSGSSERPMHDFDLGYSFRFVVGSHPSEAFLTIRSNNSTPQHSVRFWVNNPISSSAVNQLQLVMPMRTTTPLNVSVTILPLNSSMPVGPFFAPNVTQNLVIDLAMAGATWTSSSNHTFRVQVDFWMNDTGNLTNWVFMPMERDVSSTLEQIDTASNATRVHFYQVRPWAEVRESIRVGGATPSGPLESSGTPETRDWSTRAKEALLGLGLIGLSVGSVFLGAFVAGASFGLAIPIALGVGAAGFSAGAAGITLVADAVFSPDGTGLISDGLKARIGQEAQMVADVLKGAAALAACGGSLLVQGTAAKVALGAACALLVGSLVSGVPLLDLVLKFVEIVKKAIELVGHIFADLLEWFQTYAIPALTVIAIFLGVMLTLYSVIVPLKYIAMALLAPIAALQGYEHASDWSAFRRVHNIYLPIWSDFVERKWFGMEVRA